MTYDQAEAIALEAVARLVAVTWPDESPAEEVDHQRAAAVTWLAYLASCYPEVAQHLRQGTRPPCIDL